MLEEQSHPWYYKITYFFIANQVVFKRLGMVLLILLNISLWWLAGTKLVNYLAGGAAYQKMLTQLAEQQIDWQNYHQQRQPQDIEILLVDKIRVSEKKYTLVAKVSNPNEKMGAAKLSYAFMVDGYITEWQESFIMPQSQKYLFLFSYAANSSPRQINLQLRDIQWQSLKKIDAAETLKTLTPQQKPEFSKTSSLSQVKFQIINQTPYSFWQTGWQVALYRNQKILGVNYLTLNNFLAGQQRQASASWSEVLDAPTTIEVLPDINLFDENNFITDANYSPVNLIRGARTRK